VITRIKAALGWLAGSVLGLAIIVAIVLLPVCVVLWIGSALGVPWAGATQARIAIWLTDAFALANELLPAWAWFGVLMLLWLAFLDVHVRALVRDECSKYLKAQNERGTP
jgi:hypothetical protein